MVSHSKVMYNPFQSSTTKIHHLSCMKLTLTFHRVTTVIIFNKKFFRSLFKNISTKPENKGIMKSSIFFRDVYVNGVLDSLISPYRSKVRSKVVTMGFRSRVSRVSRFNRLWVLLFIININNRKIVLSQFNKVTKNILRPFIYYGTKM